MCAVRERERERERGAGVREELSCVKLIHNYTHKYA